MNEHYSKVPVPDLFVFETNQLLEKLERLILDGEKSGGLASAINEVFRVMHTIKGSAAMMMFNDISSLAHSVEDVFYYLRETRPAAVNYSELTDLLLDVADFIKGEVAKVENGCIPNGDCSELTEEIRFFLAALKSAGPSDDNSRQAAGDEVKMSGEEKTKYEAVVFFEEDCGMENIRAFTLTHELNELAENIEYSPRDILENDSTSEIIRQEGFKITFSSQHSLETLQTFFAKTMFLKEVNLSAMDAITTASPEKKKTILLDGPMPDEPIQVDPASDVFMLPAANQEAEHCIVSKQSFISVNVAKMDLLMDLVGELVIAEAMVTQNPELQGLNLDRFNKSARQLRKITGELQDVVMSIRMVPLSATFHKMNRVVRDTAKKLDKKVELEISGEQTEVDKNIIESISDPLMHLIRNAVDHGIEHCQERVTKGKSATGKIRLEAKNAGGDVWIIVQDDGGGLNREKILSKALERGLIQKEDSPLTDKQVYSFILQPGFSTKEAVTELSGRGVGMDVVAKNIEKIGGTINLDSVEGCGTTMSIRIPLTLAIIDGMIVKAGNAIYTIPIIAIKESFRLKDQNLIKDTDNNEMIMIRGDCYPVLRLHERFRIQSAVTDLYEGIMIMVETDGKSLCLFADALLGQQQVVVKALPRYIKKMKGIAGCTLLGDGSVSLILDVAELAYL